MGIKLPGIGPVSNKWVMFVGVGSVGAIGFFWYRKKKNAAAAAAAAASTTPDPNSIDPATGLTYAQETGSTTADPSIDPTTGIPYSEEQGLTSGYESSGTGAMPESYYIPAGSTQPGAGGFTTNAEWAQQAEADLANAQVDPATLSAAIGAYLTARTLTTDQESLVDEAIGFEGYPPVSGPNGYPPNMHSQGAVKQPAPKPPAPKPPAPKPKPAATVTVPKITGETKNAADAKLKADKLKSHITGTGKNIVRHQSPAAGAKVPVGSTVTGS